MTVLDVDMV